MTKNSTREQLNKKPIVLIIVGENGMISEQPCPEGQSGTATWECGYDGHWIDYPDLSACSKIDIKESIDELNEENSQPSIVIEKLNAKIRDENDLGAGDIANIIDFLDMANLVQNERLESASDPSQYAKEYTSQSVKMFGDILDRSESWFGLPTSNKNEQLSKLQINVENVTKSMLTFTKEDEQSFSNKNLQITIKRGIEDNGQEVFTNENGDEIQVIPFNGNAKSVGFYGYNNFDCIVDGKFDW